jgi:hypothetical protein
MNPFAPTFDELPKTLPIFPLPFALLLPRGRLPLNLFEPRYLNMGIDAMKGDQMIGMVQPVEPERDPVSADAELFHTGCAGRITSFSETDDGRLLITLTGMCRFDIAREIEGDGGYRRVEPDYSPYRSDMDPAGTPIELDRERLVELLRAYAAHKGFELDWSAIDKAGDEVLLTSLAMMCPFEGQEKQALLEAPTLNDLSRVVMALLEMAVPGAGGGGAKH